MRNFYFAIFALILQTGIQAQNIQFADANLQFKIVSADTWNRVAIDNMGQPIRVDENYDGQISVIETRRVVQLDVSYSDVQDLNGIEQFIALGRLECHHNAISSINLDLYPNLFALSCNDNLIETFILNNTTRNLSELNCNNNLITSIHEDKMPMMDFLSCANNPLVSLNLSILSHVRVLDASYLPHLNLKYNVLPLLMSLKCKGNQLTNFDSFNQVAAMGHLDVSNNLLITIDISMFPTLNGLTCSYNQLTSLEITNATNPNMRILICDHNNLTSIVFIPHPQTDVSQYVCNDNRLTNLNMHGIGRSLSYFNCSNNLLTTLDLSNEDIRTVTFDGNPLETVFMKTTLGTDVNNFPNTPTLKYICTKDYQVEALQNTANRLGLTNCVVNSYCSFTPGGAFLNVTGNVKFDTDNNGCEVSDLGLPLVQFGIVGNSTTGSLTSDASGHYSIPLQYGVYTLTQALEEPSYFNISPPNVIADFYTQVADITQDFCVTANGVHPDLEVALFPLTPLRPGFDATYKLLYKNKGNSIQSGTVTLNFNDANLDFVSANPIISSQANNQLSWNFTNLKPFETGAVTVVFNANSPMETPPVNNGDILNYTALIASSATDDTPNDNTFAFHHTVINSLDPNEKTCLEGDSITPEMAGKYVHYKIRFENTGTANAKNIVVKDIIAI